MGVSTATSMLEGEPEDEAALDQAARKWVAETVEPLVGPKMGLLATNIIEGSLKRVIKYMDPERVRDRIQGGGGGGGGGGSSDDSNDGSEDGDGGAGGAAGAVASPWCDLVKLAIANKILDNVWTLVEEGMAALCVPLLSSCLRPRHCRPAASRTRPGRGEGVCHCCQAWLRRHAVLACSRPFVVPVCLLLSVLYATAPR